MRVGSRRMTVGSRRMTVGSRMMSQKRKLQRSLKGPFPEVSVATTFIPASTFRVYAHACALRDLR